MTVFELMQALGEMPLNMPVHFWANGKRQDIVEVRNVGDCVDLYENEDEENINIELDDISHINEQKFFNQGELR
jgi:hypothetical protein